MFVKHNTLYNVACTEQTLQLISRQGEIAECAFHFRPHPLLAEEKIRRLSLRGIEELSEPIMQPLPVMAFQEESAPALGAPVPDSNTPQTRDPEEDLLCIAKTFSYLRESGKTQLPSHRVRKMQGPTSTTWAPRRIPWSHFRQEPGSVTAMADSCAHSQCIYSLYKLIPWTNLLLYLG